MTTNPISHDQPRDTAGRFGTKPQAEAGVVDLFPSRYEQLDRAKQVAADLAAFLDDPDYKTPAQQLEARWSRNPGQHGVIGVPIDMKVVALNEDTAQCPMCEGTAKVWGSTEVECYLCEGQPGIPLSVADEFVADAKKTIDLRPAGNETDYEGITEDRAWSRFGGIVEAEEWGGRDIPS